MPETDAGRREGEIMVMNRINLSELLRRSISQRIKSSENQFFSFSCPNILLFYAGEYITSGEEEKKEE